MIRLFLAATASALLSACASWNFVTRDLGDPTTGVSVDIKQRMVFVNKINEAGQVKSTRICAEPSPDAISSFGASVGVSALRPSGSTTQVGLSTSEAAAFIGLRTQSIQLMRDAMYRGCEAYLSGAIKEEDYLLLQRRFQAQVVGLLAIEQLTGTVAAQPITVNTSSASAIGGGANEEANRLALARTQLAEQQVKQAASKKAADDAKASYEKLSAVAGKFSSKKPEELSEDEKKTRSDSDAANEAFKKADAQRQLDEALAKIYADAVAVAEEDFKLAKGRVRTSSAGTASVPVQLLQRLPSDQAINKVAESVQFIIAKVFKVAFSDSDDLCYRRMFSAINDEKRLQALAKVCLSIAKEEEAAAAAVAAREEAEETGRPSAGGATTNSGQNLTSDQPKLERDAKTSAGGRKSEKKSSAQINLDVQRAKVDALAGVAAMPGSARVLPTKPAADAADPASSPASSGLGK